MRRRSSGELAASFKRYLLLLLFFGLVGYLGYQMWLYLQARQLLPAGMVIANIDVAGLTLEEAGEKIESQYMAPVIIWHRDEPLELNPQDVGFALDMEGMLAEAERYRTSQNFWKGYLFHLLGWTWEPMAVPLMSSYDPARVAEIVQIAAGFLDEPAKGPQILPESSAFQTGHGGFATDISASVPDVEAALQRPDERSAKLVVVDEEAPELNFDLLQQVIEGQLQKFPGLGSIYILDLQTGEEININSDVAMSGLSILKIAIFEEAYRALDEPPDATVQQYFYETAVHSSNFDANLLLHVVAGEDNTYRGADILTESMRRLGLVNTFIAVPYDANPPAYRQTTYQTLANTREDAPAGIDISRQSTAAEIGTLLSMIYYCSKGGGTLLAVYPGDITPTECQAIIDLMVLNEEGNLIRFGVPHDVPVSHKHGWVPNTHADAGIVFSPGGDYVLVEYLHQDDGWLVAEESFPILREISRAVYNYYNFDNPYLGDALQEDHRFDPADPFNEGSGTATTDSTDSPTPTPGRIGH